MSSVPDAPALNVRTVALTAGIGPLLEYLPRATPTAWVRDGEGLVAWGEAARITPPADTRLHDARRFERATRELTTLFSTATVEDQVGVPGTGMVAFGSFTFDPRSPGSVLIVPRVVLGQRAGRTWLTTISEHPDDWPGPPVPSSGDRRPTGPLTWEEGRLSAREWAARVGTAVERIRAGELDKVVLARDLSASAEGDIDVRPLLERLSRDYPSCYTFSVDGMVGATPELLLQREGDRVSSLVLAGTRPRGAEDGEDARLAAELTNSAKDTEEHRYAVDSLRSTLAPLSSTIDIPPRPQLLQLANVQHLASPVGATLEPGVATLDVVAAMHPTAAVGGTPSITAMETIRELEGMDRGRYAGPVGWIDHQGNGEWGIALRCAMVRGSQARLFAGCGIVAASDPTAEVAETEPKFRVMRAALAN
ncbi:isochorismate synthase [Haloactinospora alba]|uniref:isochorismate synthase n=1 Tax=Haloactinospora alba TaxID=405555 RepID=UPI0011535ECB|nr:isochorismate synthase [Haloactinospora alba]